MPDELPPLPSGMINVTRAQVGYQFLPAGSKFEEAVEVVLPLDMKAKYASIWKTLGALTYYWDESNQRWDKLDTISIDLDKGTIRSRTTHFTMMINAVNQAPVQATPNAFDANAIKDFGQASAAANIDLIGPPEANNKGDAQTFFPIRLPTGRGAFSPSLQITYSSSGGNGPLGVGWQLSGSQVEVDTRWGVPRYDGTERYLLNGIAIVPVAREDFPDLDAVVACSSGELVWYLCCQNPRFQTDPPVQSQLKSAATLGSYGEKWDPLRIWNR